jgi:L-asparaginase II
VAEIIGGVRDHSQDHPVGYQPVVEIIRGGIVESIHFGAVAVADPRGNLIAWFGDPDTVTFLRSSAKPFQALPLVESGAADAFDLTKEQLAVICASHSGTDRHVEVVRAAQAQFGVGEGDLLCGVHPPLDPETARRLRAEGREPTPIRHNCSGKHTGMLGLARFLGAPLAEYTQPDHPVQQRILKAFSEMCDVSPGRVGVAIDGCSVPTFAVSLRAAATAYARLGDPSGLAPGRAGSCRRIFSAMSECPFLVAGPGRFDTALMEACGGRLVAKGGAEGYFGVALSPGSHVPGSSGLGIAVKIADGDQGKRSDVPPGQRAGARVVLAVLEALGVLNGEESLRLSEFAEKRLTNWRGLTVGEARTSLRLERPK